MSLPLDAPELFLRHQQARSHPALPLIARVPPFHIGANSLHDGESRLDHIGAGQCLAQLRWNLEAMHGERFFHSFGQAARRARIAVHQLAVQLVQGQLGRVVVLVGIRRIQLLRHQRLLIFAQMIQHIAALVNLSALDQRRLSGMTPYRR